VLLAPCYVREKACDYVAIICDASAVLCDVVVVMCGVTAMLSGDMWLYNEEGGIGT
jgi:hypothetical protein